VDGDMEVGKVMFQKYVLRGGYWEHFWRNKNIRALIKCDIRQIWQETTYFGAPSVEIRLWGTFSS